MSKSIKENFFYNILLNVSSVIFPLITAPYVSRVLEPEGIGLNNFANTYAGYFALVALLGIPTYGAREVAKIRDDNKALSQFLSQIMSIAAISTLFVSIIYICSILFVGQLTENYIIFLIAGFVIYLAPFKINWYFQGIEDFGFITFRSLIIRLVSIICLFLFVHEKNDLIIYVILHVLGSVIADVWNYTKMWRSGIRPNFTLKGLRRHINPLLILFTSYVAVSIYTVLDTIMLGFLTNYEEVGFYTNAMHIAKVILSAITSLSIVVVPRVSYLMKSKDYKTINDLMNKSFAVVSFLAFPVTIGLVCISSTFIPLFFGIKFCGSIFPFMILSLLIIVIGFNNLTGYQILIGMGLDKPFMYCIIGGAISNFMMNCAFIPIWGAIGASVASVAAETIVLILTFIFAYRHTVVRIINWKDIAKAFVGSLSLIPIFLLLQSFYKDWLLIFVFFIIGSCSYFILEAFMKNKSISLFLSIINIKKFKNRRE